MTTAPHRRLAAVLALLALAALGAAPRAADAACVAGMTLTKPDDRYQDNGDGTITDKVTNLSWKRCSEGQAWNGTTCTGSFLRYTWVQALGRATAASTAAFAGHADWRLPNLKELLSIVEWSCSSPSINLTAFPATPNETYWSSTPYLDFNSEAYIVRFWDASDLWESKGIACAVRLVRTAP